MPTSTSLPMSPGEQALLAHLLDLAAEQFSYKSCTDYPLAASAANKAIVAAAIERAAEDGWQDYVAAVMAEDEQLVIFMDWMAAHLGARCREQALSRAELAIAADMLDVAREDHDEAEELGLVPHAIDVTNDNRAILNQISDAATRPPGQETRVPLKAALIYFVERCAN